MARKWPFSYFFCILFIIFGASTRGGGFQIATFSYFRAWGVFELYTRNAESQVYVEVFGVIPFFRQEQKSTKINFRVRRPPGGVGGLPREGVVAEKFLPSLESLPSLGFEERNLGCPGNFAWMSRTPWCVQKVCTKKSSCAFFVPYLWGRKKHINKIP